MTIATDNGSSDKPSFLFRIILLVGPAFVVALMVSMNSAILDYKDEPISPQDFGELIAKQQATLKELSTTHSNQETKIEVLIANNSKKEGKIADLTTKVEDVATLLESEIKSLQGSLNELEQDFKQVLGAERRIKQTNQKFAPVMTKLNGVEASVQSVVKQISNLRAAGGNMDDTAMMNSRAQPAKLSTNTTQSTNITQLPLGPDPFVPSNGIDLCADPNNFRNNSGVFAIVAGIEHTGTTMAASLLQNAPNLYGAFECGLLMVRSPKEFRPCKRRKTNYNCVHQTFYDLMSMSTKGHGWGISEAQREQMINIPKCHAEQYAMLRSFSPYFQPSTINEGSWLVDKTPMYYRKLLSVMEQTPGVPVILTQRYNLDILDSYAKRGIATKYARKALKEFHQNKEACETVFPDRLFVLDFNKFGEQPHTVMAEMFAFLGLQWDPSYLSNERFNAKGEPFGRQRSPPFNLTRLNCKDCVGSNPYTG